MLAESVRKAVDEAGLSWVLFDDHVKGVVTERLRTIGNLDESQCNELFDKMNGMRSIEVERKRRTFILDMARILYEKWIMKCMHCISE